MSAIKNACHDAITELYPAGSPWPCRVAGCGTLMLQRPGACGAHPVGPSVDDPTGLVTVSYHESETTPKHGPATADGFKPDTERVIREHYEQTRQV
jgi:hypothetical protein